MEPRADHQRKARRRYQPPPLTAARLDEMALAYVARFATSAGKLDQYCRRKLRERGWAGQDEGDPAPDVAAIVSRMVEAGYVDDAGYARLKAGAMQRRGLGVRRIDQTLRAAGITEDTRQAAYVGERAKREAAATFARRKRLGPWARSHGPEARQKAFAAVVRAGHSLDIARTIVDARTEQEIQSWIEEVADEH